MRLIPRRPRRTADESDHDESRGGQMTLVEHLTELRRRLIVSIIAVGLGMIVVFALWRPIIHWMSGPYADVTKSVEEPDGKNLIFTKPLEAFTTRLKVLVLALPVWLWQLWRFITPGLHPREKRYAIPFVLSSVVLFLAGATIGWITMPKALEFLITDISGGELEAFISAGEYLSLVSLIMLAFGASFEFPVVLVFLLIARVLKTSQLRQARRYAIVGITVFAAVITPSQDPYTLFFLAGPMYLFYEVSILIGRILKR
jgi:sec-independent protein translocase protein TatC